MSGIVENIKNNIVGYLTVLALSTLIFLAKDIFSDLLPAILPSLQKISITTYLKIVILLLILTISLFSLTIILAFKSRSSIPIAMSGKYCGIKYVAQIDSRRLQKDGDVIINVSWHCPIHDIFLTNSSDTINGDTIPALLCKACGKHYYFLRKGVYLNWNEATEIIRDTILHKIHLNPKS